MWRPSVKDGSVYVENGWIPLKFYVIWKANSKRTLFIGRARKYNVDGYYEKQLGKINVMADNDLIVFVLTQSLIRQNENSSHDDYPLSAVRFVFLYSLIKILHWRKDDWLFEYLYYNDVVIRKHQICVTGLCVESTGDWCIPLREGQ